MTARNDFLTLPWPDTPEGDPRRCGVEIEFGGLTERDAADVVQSTLGGTITNEGPHLLAVNGSRIGKVMIELDTKLRKASTSKIVEKGLDLTRGIVPVEIVTDPLDQRGLRSLNDLVAALREAGALGSRAGVLLGFGVHLNPEVPDEAATGRIVQAFAALEPDLRQRAEIDPTRRLLPFVAPWPDAFRSAVIDAEPRDMKSLLDLAGEHLSSRNHGLDLLPMLEHADPERFAELFPEKGKSAARPTFHVRFPDCRIDEPDWSLSQAWNEWRDVETVAADEEALAQACAAATAGESRPRQVLAALRDELPRGA